MIASVTELNIKNFWAYLRFIPHAVKSKMQADRAPGIIDVRVASGGLFVQRTLTVWESEEAIKSYVRSRPHLDAMKMFSKIANKSYTVHFEVQSLPTWEEALEHLRKNGRSYG